MASMEIHNLQTVNILCCQINQVQILIYFYKYIFFLQRVAHFRKKENYVFKKHAYLKK